MGLINESILSAGFGGQGIMLLGKVLATAGMEQNLHVTYLPSYGAEVRGGTAHSMVRISSHTIGNPVIEKADTGIIMNEPSLVKFEKKIKPGGLLILNKSLIKEKVSRSDIDIVEVELTDEAIKLGNIKVANMIALSIFATKKDIIKKETLCDVVKKMGSAKKVLIEINLKAIEIGIRIAEEKI